MACIDSEPKKPFSSISKTRTTVITTIPSANERFAQFFKHLPFPFFTFFIEWTFNILLYIFHSDTIIKFAKDTHPESWGWVIVIAPIFRNQRAAIGILLKKEINTFRRYSFFDICWAFRYYSKPPLYYKNTLLY